MLKQKLRMIYQGEAFNGKPTKTARSHGRKFQVTIKQETSRILVFIICLKNCYKFSYFLFRCPHKTKPKAVSSVIMQ